MIPTSYSHLDVQCPRCDALPGDTCRTTGARIFLEGHVGRHDLARIEAENHAEAERAEAERLATRRANAELHPCPACGAGPRYACEDVNGRGIPPHAGRYAVIMANDGDRDVTAAELRQGMSIDLTDLLQEYRPADDADPDDVTRWEVAVMSAECEFSAVVADTELEAAADGSGQVAVIHTDLGSWGVDPSWAFVQPDDETARWTWDGEAWQEPREPFYDGVLLEATPAFHGVVAEHYAAGTLPDDVDILTIPAPPSWHSAELLALAEAVQALDDVARSSAADPQDHDNAAYAVVRAVRTYLATVSHALPTDSEV